MTHKNPRLNHVGLRTGLFIVLVSMLAVIAGPIHGYASSQSFSLLRGQPQGGMLVSLTPHPGVIEAATNKNANSLIGVIGSAETNLDQSPGQVSVKTDGAANALISTLNGDVNVGDRITASAIEGVGAKANSNGWIVGVAQGSLDSKTNGAVKSTVTDSKGVKHDVFLASVPIAVKVTYYSSSSSASKSQSTSIPESIQKIADTIVGKHVSTIAIILSFSLSAVGILVAGMVVNGAVKGGILGVSRQPLAKRVILRTVGRAILVAVLIMGFVFALAVLTLKIF